MQVDGYSLDAQKNKMKAFCDYNNYEIAGEYEDAGKSGKSIEGRMQKAREGRWNGGFAQYGYSLVNGELIINEEEAAAVREMFNQYVNTDLGAVGVAKYLDSHGFERKMRTHGATPMFSASLIKSILKNPVYCGKIAYGRSKTENVHGTRNDYHRVEQEDYLLVDGIHEGLVSEEVWEQAQIKRKDMANKYKRYNRTVETVVLLSKEK